MFSYRLYTPGTQPGWQLTKYLPWLASWSVPGWLLCCLPLGLWESTLVADLKILLALVFLFVIYSLRNFFLGGDSCHFSNLFGLSMTFVVSKNLWIFFSVSFIPFCWGRLRSANLVLPNSFCRSAEKVGHSQIMWKAVSSSSHSFLFPSLSFWQ